MRRLRLIPCLFIMPCALLLAVGSSLLPLQVRAAGSQQDAAHLARQILDEGRSESDRKRIIAENPRLSLELLQALVADMPPGNTKEEYRRIPWIWRVTVAAAKRNDLHEMKPIVEFTLPQRGEPLHDWQAVVLGGGIINGIGLVGAWPDERIEKLLGDDPALRSRWKQTLEEAAAMADNPNVFNGTRYDALRIIGVDTWDRRGAQLAGYLRKRKGVDDELVQGAIGGLGTMRSPHAARALLSEFRHYNAENRGFALDALLKDGQRMAILLDAVEAGIVKPGDLGPAREAKLTHSSQATVRLRARKLLTGAER